MNIANVLESEYNCFNLVDFCVDSSHYAVEGYGSVTNDLVVSATPSCFMMGEM